MQNLSPKEVADRLRASPGSMVLLDVREPYERATAAIEPSLHIPMQEVPGRSAEIPVDKTVVVYCHTGSRSLLVAAYLEGEGFRSIANLRGGIHAWSREVDPNVPQYG